MANHQKGVQQDTAYSAVVVNDHIMYPRPCLYPSNMTLLGQKQYRDGDTYDHSLQLSPSLYNVYRHYDIRELFCTKFYRNNNFRNFCFRNTVLTVTAIVLSEYSYWFFQAITYENKIFSKIHKLKTEKSLIDLYHYLSVELSDVFARAGTDK